jgi:CRISPR-associated protein Csm2
MDFKKNFNPEWIGVKMDEDSIKFAEKLGKHLCDPNPQQNDRPGFNAMTTTQIRNIFSEIKRIQRVGIEKSVTDFLLVKPKMAYTEARVISKNKNSRISQFREVVDMAYDAVNISAENNRRERFQRFVDFLEAILAYHKAYGGRD